MDIKGEIKRNTVIEGDFSTPMISIDKFFRQNVNQERAILNDALGWMDLIDIFRAFFPQSNRIYFSSVHGMFLRIDHMLRHKTKSQ